MAYFAETERESIRQRQAESIAAAKAKGKHLGRRPDPLRESCGVVIALCLGGELSIRKAAASLNMSRTTFYRHFIDWKHKNTIPEDRLSGTGLL